MTSPERPDPSGNSNPHQVTVERRAPRWMKAVLVLSLGVNAVVAGLVIGVALRGGPSDGPSRAFREGAMPLTQALHSEERRAIGRDIRRTLKASEGPRDRRAEFEQTLVMLRAERFDPVAFANHLQMQADRGLVRIKTSQSALIRHLDALSFAERQAYADRVEAIILGPKKPEQP